MNIPSLNWMILAQSFLDDPSKPIFADDFLSIYAWDAAKYLIQMSLHKASLQLMLPVILCLSIGNN
jgi:hypothetical protein